MIPQTTTPEHTARIILDAVQKHELQAGIERLALMLRGSKSQRLKELESSTFYGALFYCTTDVIENFIRQLLKQGYLTLTDVGKIYPAPVLKLTENGKGALESKTDIPLKEVRLPPTLNETMQETLQKFTELRDITKVTEARGMAVSTIWTHLINCVTLGLLRASDVVAAERMQRILEVQQRLKTGRVGPIKQALPDVSYEEIRCVLAERASQKQY